MSREFYAVPRLRMRIQPCYRAILRHGIVERGAVPTFEAFGHLEL